MHRLKNMRFLSMNNRSITLLIVTVTVLLGILVNLVANIINLPLSQPIALVVLSIIALVSINFVDFQFDLQNGKHPSQRRKAVSVFLASGVTIILGSLLSVVIFEKNQLSNLQLSRLRIGLLPDGNRVDLNKENIIKSHLSEKLNNIDVTIETVGPQYVDTMNAVVKGNKEVAYFGPLLYLHTIKRHEEIKPILFMPPDNPEESYYYSYIITRSDSGITSLEGVRGKPFIFGDEWSTSGTLYPKYFLKKAGIDVKGTHDSSHREIVKRVLERKNIVIGAISSFAYENYVSNLNAGQENQLVILNKSEAEQHPILPGPIVLRAGIQDYDALRIKDAYLSINDPFILNTMATGKFTSLTSEEAKGAYKPVADIFDSLGVNL
jgi:phosphonate transport system substrate-binding protein